MNDGSEPAHSANVAAQLVADAQAALSGLARAAADLPRGPVAVQVGTVQSVGSGVATVSGLPAVQVEELVTFGTGVLGMVLDLDERGAQVILLGPEVGIRGGDIVTPLGRNLDVPVGARMLGRVVDPLGRPRDGGAPLAGGPFGSLDRDPPAIVARDAVAEPLHTGVKAVDALLPVGKGQRLLLLGDRQTGKSALALDAVLNQRRRGVACVVVMIGQKTSSVLGTLEILEAAKALAHTAVVVATGDDPPALRYLAPMVGCAIAEDLAYQGWDTLVVYDDLSRHADAYRELSLLLRRPPGREAYPGDVFYLHARLLERAANLGADAGGGSITAIPIAETQLGNVAGYLPTNLISICDGQVIFNADLFNRGQRPAIDVGLSVSRVGGSAQSPALRRMAGALRLEVAQYTEVARFGRLGTDLDAATQRQIDRGQRAEAVLRQAVHAPLDPGEVLAVLFALVDGAFDSVALDEMAAVEARLLAALRTKDGGLLAEFEASGDVSADAFGLLRELVAASVAS